MADTIETHSTAFFDIRNKFENLAATKTIDRRGTISQGSSPYAHETSTLGRRVSRNSSFTFGNHMPNPSASLPVVTFPYIARDLNSRSSNRSLQDYDSFTIAATPRRLKKQLQQYNGHASPNVLRKCKEKLPKDPLSVMKLSPAQSLSSLSSPSSSLASSPSPQKIVSSSVFNLAIEPSQCVS
jgi:hypothetical protein